MHYFEKIDFDQTFRPSFTVFILAEMETIKMTDF